MLPVSPVASPALVLTAPAIPTAPAPNLPPLPSMVRIAIDGRLVPPATPASTAAPLPDAPVPPPLSASARMEAAWHAWDGVMRGPSEKKERIAASSALLSHLQACAQPI